MKFLLLLLLVSILFISSIKGDSDLDLQDAEAMTIGELSSDDLDTINSNSEGAEFQAEVNRLMEIIIHSLYKNRDIFLRELISNAVDALDKIRYQSLLDKDVASDNPDFEIKVQVNKESGLLTIVDTGVGMTKEELQKNLGTIAHSGTAAFVDAFSQAQENPESALPLIGQFGVGFYSAFLVADEVIVVSKSAKSDTQYIWRSAADGQFTIAEDPRGNTLGRGTAIILKIKEDATEFLETGTIERTITRYSEFMQYPIYMYSTRTEQIEAPPSEDDDVEDVDSDDLEATDDDEPAEPKTIDKIIPFWKRLNSNKPIWSKRPSEVTDDEYENFYESFAKKTNEIPLSYTHFKAEGEIEFDSILYIPSKAPQGMYDNYYQHKSLLKLYVRRVLVADDFEDIIPQYLNFITGLVDSNDLPLNVNRDDLQKNRIMVVIKRKLTRKILDMLQKLAKGDLEIEIDMDKQRRELEEAGEEVDEDNIDKPVKKYIQFWNEFGKSIKLGILEDQKNKKKLIELLRFQSTRSPDEPISLKNYIDNMSQGQKFIYCISAASVDEIENSPFLERFRKKNLEVLYFIDPLDEYMNLDEYDDIKFQNIAKEDVELDGNKMKEFLEQQEEEFDDLKKYLKKIYKDKVSKVKISSTLASSPMAVATATYGTSARMQKIIKNQAFGSSYPQRATKILSINYRHPIINGLREKLENDGEDDENVKDLALLLLDQAMVKSGFDIEPDDQTEFANRIVRIVQNGYGIPLDAELLPEPEFANTLDSDDDIEEDDDFEEEEEEEELEEEIKVEL